MTTPAERPASIDDRIYRRWFAELEASGRSGALLADELRAMRDEGALAREADLMDLYERLGAQQE